MHAAPADITGLLVAWGKGDRAALETLVPLVQQELRRVASRQMALERRGHLLQPTALVNEVYIRLVDWKNVEWQNRAHFFAVAAGMMRRILVNAAKARDRAKRGGGEAISVSLDDVAEIAACMERLVADSTLRDRLALAGPARAAEFTWRATAAGTLAAILDASR